MLEKAFQDRGFRTKGFTSRREVWDYLGTLPHAADPSEIPVAIATDYLTVKDDIKMQDFLKQMDARFPDIAIFISTMSPSLVHRDEIIFPRNTKGVCMRGDLDYIINGLQGLRQQQVQ